MAKLESGFFAASRSFIMSEEPEKKPARRTRRRSAEQVGAKAARKLKAQRKSTQASGLAWA